MPFPSKMAGMIFIMAALGETNGCGMNSLRQGEGVAFQNGVRLRLKDQQRVTSLQTVILTQVLRLVLRTQPRSISTAAF
jgi:hypothetical protein